MNVKLLAVVAALSLPLLNGCHTAPKTEEGRENLKDDVQTALNRFERADPGLKDFLHNAAGYAMFPSIGKAGFIVGGAYGKGELFENGAASGYASMTQASVGAQAGAQDYAELVVFGEQSALNKFKDEKLEFGANASAVILKAGASSSASFRDGVAVFADSKAGAMIELSVSGQKFTYRPMGDTNTTETKTTETHETHEAP